MLKLSVTSTLLAIVLHGAAAAKDQAAAKVILEQAIKAQGGEALMAKLVAVHFKLKGTSYDGATKSPLSIEFFLRSDGALRTIASYDDMKTVSVEVIHGKDGWSKEDNETPRRLNDAEIRANQEYAYSSWISGLIPLRAKEFQLSVLAEASVSGRRMVGLLVSHEKHDPVRLYFDKESHLLVKCETRRRNAETETASTEESFYSNYKPVQGVQTAFAMKVCQDNVKIADLAVVEANLSDKALDEKLFSKP